RLARRRGGDAVGLDARLDPGALARARRDAALRQPGVLARRGDALHLAHLADLLSLHVLPLRAVRPHAAVLDQHGGDGDLDARRYAAPREGRVVAAPHEPPPLPARLHD